MRVDTYPYEPKSLLDFKRFMVRSENHQELEAMAETVYAMQLESGTDYVVAGATIYFDTDEARTLFLLSHKS